MCCGFRDEDTLVNWSQLDTNLGMSGKKEPQVRNCLLLLAHEAFCGLLTDGRGLGVFWVVPSLGR